MLSRARFAMIFRLVLFATLAALMVSTAQAAPPRVDAGIPCTRTSNAVDNPYALLAKPQGFACGSAIGVIGPVTYGLITGIRLVTDPHDPWELRHEYSQARTQAVYVRYADGTMAKAPSDRTSARRPFSPGMVSYALPGRPGTIVAVLVVAEGLQNQRGIAPAAEFLTGRAALESDVLVLALYGLLAGIVIALLCYNLALHAALRYPFILRYCFSAMAMLGMGISWSGAIFLLLPALDTTTQISITMFFTSLVLATSSLFMLSFLEPEHVSAWPRRFTLAISMLGIASCIVRIVDPVFAWQAIDRVTYLSMFGALGGVTVTAIVALLRGSRAARIYLIAWAVPILLAVARIMWGIGLIPGESVLVAISPLIIMAMEALMSALAVTWRIGLLRDERDELRHFAEIDALTGLLNRRAFIARAQAIGRDGMPRRLIVADIDRFKLVNDRYGHQTGDDVLIRVADALRTTAPEGTIIGRIGGEEFALLVPAEPVDALPDRLCRVVAASAGRDEIEVTISAGVADGSCRDDGDWRRLYYAADQALYRAKHGGRNRVSLAPQSLAAA